MRILREETAAVIIDIQERLYPHIYEHQALSDRTAILIQGLKVLNIETLVTQQYTKGLGETVASVRALFEPFHHIEKTAFSCCDDPGFSEVLKKLDKKNIILAGIETHVCVLQTALDLIEQGFMPVIIEDCVSSRNPADKNTAVLRLRSEGAIISSSESILFELCRYSGTDEFKAISKLVK